MRNETPLRVAVDNSPEQDIVEPVVAVHGANKLALSEAQNVTAFLGVKALWSEGRILRWATSHAVLSGPAGFQDTVGSELGGNVVGTWVGLKA